MASRVHFSSEQPMDVDVVWGRGDSSDSAAGSVRIHFSSEEPGNLSITWRPRIKRARLGEGPHRRGEGEGRSAADSEDEASKLTRSAAGSDRSAAGPGRSAVLAPMPLVADAPELRPVSEPDDGWAGLSTHFCNMRLAKLGSMWGGLVVACNPHNEALDIFANNMRSHFTLWAGPEFAGPTPALGGFWLAKVAFGRWVGDGFRPFDTFGRLKSLQVMARAYWRTTWVGGGAFPVGVSHVLPELDDNNVREAWDYAVACKWSGDMALFVSMAGERAEVFYKGSDFAHIQPEDDKLMVCDLILTYWANDEPRVHGTVGRMLKITVIGHTELLFDWSKGSPSAEGSGLARALPGGSVGGSRRIGSY